MLGARSQAIISLWRTVLAALLALLLFWVSVPYGGVTPSGLLGLRLSAAAALFLAALTKDLRFSVLRLRIALAGLGGLAALAAVQSLRWPHGIVTLIFPDQVLRALQHNGVTSGSANLTQPLSLAPTASASAALATLSLIALLVAASAAGRHRRYRRWIAVGCLGGALFQVVYGLRPLIAGRIPRLSGTFVNPDHLALYLEIALCVGLSFIWGLVRWARRETRLELQILTIAGAASLWLVLFVGLLFTGSRAALLAVSVGLGIGSVLLAIAWRRKRVGVVAFAVSCGAAVALAAVSGTRGLGRVVGLSWHEAIVEGRLRVWAEAADLIPMSPIFGTGLGSFEESFPLVQSESTVRILWGRVHNDFLELLITGGVVGVALAMVAAVGMVEPLIRAVRYGTRTEDRLAAVAALSALAATATHELFDFGLSLPANSATLVIVIGAATASQLRGPIADRDQPDEVERVRRADSPAAGQRSS